MRTISYKIPLTCPTYFPLKFKFKFHIHISRGWGGSQGLWSLPLILTYLFLTLRKINIIISQKYILSPNWIHILYSYITSSFFSLKKTYIISNQFNFHPTQFYNDEYAKEMHVDRGEEARMTSTKIGKGFTHITSI